MSTPALVSLPELLYIHDPLCLWSYVMNPVVERLQAEYAGRVDVSLLCGGMVTGDDAGPIAPRWSAIQQSLSDVTQATSVRFGGGFTALGQAGTYEYDSEPPSRAIVAFRQLSKAPASTIAFVRAVQEALFCDGRDLNHAAAYVSLLRPFGIEASEFVRRWEDPETARATQREFAAVARIGLQGFPTCVVRLGEQGYVLARGYQAYEHLRQGLEQLLQAEGRE